MKKGLLLFSLFCLFVFAILSANFASVAATNEWSVSWYFELDTEQTPYEVTQHIELVQQYGELQLTHAKKFPLTCQTIGTVIHQAKSLVFNEQGYIQCDSVNLRSEVWNLSNQQYNICAGQGRNCRITINNIYHHYKVGAQSMYGPIFAYDNMVVSTIADNNQYTAALSFTNTGESLSIAGPHLGYAHSLTIEQDNEKLDLFVNDDKWLGTTYFQNNEHTFSGGVEPLYFGYDPDSDAYFSGVLKGGIFDPYNACHGCQY